MLYRRFRINCNLCIPWLLGLNFKPKWFNPNKFFFDFAEVLCHNTTLKIWSQRPKSESDYELWFNDLWCFFKKILGCKSGDRRRAAWAMEVQLLKPEFTYVSWSADRLTDSDCNQRKSEAHIASHIKEWYFFAIRKTYFSIRFFATVTVVGRGSRESSGKGI